MSEQRRRGPMGGRGRMMSGEKAKDFKGSMAKLFRYICLLYTSDAADEL